jgi:uncharacterized protein with GYD domain
MQQLRPAIARARILESLYGGLENHPAARASACWPDTARRARVPKYVILLNWTDTGVGNVKDTVNRYHAAKEMLESKGGSFEAIAWTIGPYDLVSIVDVPDEATGAAFNLQLAAGGNLRSVTMRAFTEDEMSGIIAKMD